MDNNNLKCVKCGESADGYISLGDLYEAPICNKCEKYLYLGWCPLDKTKDEVLEFIHRRFKADCDWKTGNCYYFAVILKERFCNNNPEIYYDVCEGHFLCKINDQYYDWSGVVEHDAEYLNRYVIKWSTFHKYDELQFERILNDVII